MSDLWLIILAVVNTLLLLICYKILIRKEINIHTWYFIRLDNLIDYISILAKDFLISMLYDRILTLGGVNECFIWTSLLILHIITDILIIRIYFKHKND